MSCSRKPARRTQGRWTLGLSLAFFVGAAAACDGLLDVELPGQITEEELGQPGQAPLLVNSAIADIECAYSEFTASSGAGYDDVMLRVTGWWGGAHEFAVAPGTNDCNTTETAFGWWSPLQAGRYEADRAYELISEWGDDEVPADRQQLLAQAAIYGGVAYGLLGEHFCEVAVEAGELMSPDEALAVAEERVTTALEHIGATGDFAISNGVSSSAEQMARLLRARIRFARGDLAGAEEDASAISAGFKAYATRDGGGERTRWNRVVNAHNESGWGTVMGPIDWWSGPGDWPDVIPFTGYRNLGILGDGRAISDDRFPITTTDEPSAVPDTRVPVIDQGEFNAFPAWKQQKYSSLEDDIPIVNWEEAWLILAEIEGGQAAIDRVNDIRTAHGLPTVTYVDPGDAIKVENMIIEERRRSLFLEGGRFWATKLRKELWFPRGVGTTPFPYAYQPGVRMVMPEDEFNLNPNIDGSDRGSLCPPHESPI